MLEGASSASSAGSAAGATSAMLLDGLEEDETSRRRAYDGASCTSSSSNRGGRATQRLSLLDNREGGAAARAWKAAGMTSFVAEEEEECEVIWDGTRVAVGGERGRGKGDKSEAAAGAAVPLLWSKPVTKNHEAGVEERRFRVVVAGQRDLDEAGALCIKVRDEHLSPPP